MQKMRHIMWVIVILIIVIVGLFAYETSPINLLMGNKTHSLECSALPAVEHVQEVLNSHGELVNKILQVNPGLVLVDADNSKCTTRADVLITVGSYNDAKAVKTLINSDTFFGVPYRILNQ
jgi:hypothetical protein